MNQFFLITVDVEDWFQVENFKPYIRFEDWPACELRVEKNTHKILDLLDDQEISATFFMLGWLAQRLPNLVKEIYKRGHEVASHGFNHNLCFNEPPENLAQDLTRSKNLLEDLIGGPVDGYRAPSFSIRDDILKIIQSAGYLYDSSFNSFGMNSRYGKIHLDNKLQKGIGVQLSENFWEIPMSNLNIGGHILPMSGGGYFRLYPFAVFKRGIQEILKQNQAYMFYMHPWEIDPDQPRVNQASPMFKFRHYLNLNTTCHKLSRIFQSFKNCRFVSCREYLNEMSK